MTRMSVIQAALFGFALVLALSSCGHRHARSNLMDTTGWNTYCFGRFLVDLPSQARVRGSDRIRGNPIKRIGFDREELRSHIESRERELRLRQHDTEGSMFLARAEHQGRSESILAWKREFRSTLMEQETFLISTDGAVAYRYGGNVSPDRVDVRGRLIPRRSRDPRAKSKLPQPWWPCGVPGGRA